MPRSTDWLSGGRRQLTLLLLFLLSLKFSKTILIDYYWAMFSAKLKSLIADLEPLVREPALFCKQNDNVAVERAKEPIRKVIKKYKLTRDDYEAYLNYSSKGYTKNLVHEFTSQNNRRANLIIMCWAPGQASLWHAHEGSRCFVRVLEGELLEQRAPIPGNRLGERSRRVCGADDGADEDSGEFRASPSHESSTRKTSSELEEAVIQHDDNEVYFIDDSIGLHRVSNLSSELPAVTMHLYSPAYSKCRIFDNCSLAGGKQLVCSASSSSRLVDVLFDNEQHTR